MDSSTATASRLYTAETLKGRDVVSMTGEHIGEIESVVIDSSRGCIAYAVLGMRKSSMFGKEKLFAIPWRALMIDEAHKDFVMDVDLEILKNSPGFDRENWPSEPDPTFAKSVKEYYGYDEDYQYKGGGTSGYQQGQSESSGRGEYDREDKGVSERAGERAGIDPDRDRGDYNR